MNVQCRQCGDVRPFDESDPICQKCGNILSVKDTSIIKNPRRGRGIIATGIVLFLCFLALFLFYSKFFGGWGMALSFLVYLWGLYRVDMNKRLGAGKDVDQTKS